MIRKSGGRFSEKIMLHQNLAVRFPVRDPRPRLAADGFIDRESTAQLCNGAIKYVMAKVDGNPICHRHSVEMVTCPPRRPL
jgi:hypothetical protein